MNHLDLCSGIGGFALAASWMGWQTIGFAEIDEFASKVLAKHWPGVPNYGDIRSVPDGTRADILTAGFPCQPYSCAGKQLGAEDDRAIWPLVIEVVKRVQPRWCVFENVAGIINMALDGVLSDLEAEGYEVGTVVVPACAVNAPHRRDRVWIVAHSAIRSDQQSESRPSERALSGRDEKGDGDVSDAASDGMEEPERQDWKQDGRCEQSGWMDAIGSRAITDSDRQSPERLAESWHQRGGGQLKSCVGGDFDGLPSGLDGPIGSGPEFWDGDWERGIPRVATGVKDRAKRLKALGNAIVPQVAYQIFRAIGAADH